MRSIQTRSIPHHRPDSFIPPSAQISPSSQHSNNSDDTAYASEPPDTRWERILIDYEDAFDRFSETPPLDSAASNPYLRPHLDAHTARRLYMEEPDGHYLGAMDRICGKCSTLLFKGEKPKWCCDKGRTEVGAPKSDIYEDDHDGFGNNDGAQTRANELLMRMNSQLTISSIPRIQLLAISPRTRNPTALRPVSSTSSSLPYTPVAYGT